MQLRTIIGSNYESKPCSRISGDRDIPRIVPSRRHGYMNESRSTSF